MPRSQSSIQQMSSPQRRQQGYSRHSSNPYPTSMSMYWERLPLRVQRAEYTSRHVCESMAGPFPN
jgi:hypothetical protein